MKLKYIFAALTAALTLAVGCQESIEPHLDEVKVSSSYVAIPACGGSDTITVNAAFDWTLSDIPEWLTVTPASGVAGEIEVVFSAEATTSTNTALLYLNCNGAEQLINVIQMTEKVELPITPCGDVNNKGEDGVTYRVKGTVTSIVSDYYGNMYVTDETGSAYIYGTLDANGGEKNFSSLGIEVGDIVTVEGPRKTYNGTIELVNVTVINIEKSLIKVDSLSVKEALPLEGGVIMAYLTCNGEAVSVSVPEDAKSWLTLSSIAVEGNKATVSFVASRNDLGDRKTTLVFNTSKEGKEYSAQVDIEQKGAIIDATVATLLAAEDGLTQYRTTGYISKDKGSEYGNIYIKDATGEIYVFGVLDDKGQTKQWLNMGIKEGDIVTVVGPKTSYNGEAQLKNVTIEKHIAVSDIAIADFRALEDNKEAYYRLTGKVAKSTEENTKFDLTTYGNFALTDGTAEIYVYGVVSGWGGEKAKFAELGINEGDELTIVCYKSSYNGLNQAGGAFYVSHVAAGEGGDEGEGGGDEGDGDDTPAEPVVKEVVIGNLGWENETQYLSLAIDDNVTVSLAGTPVGTYGLNTGKYYTTGLNWRVYQNESPSITFTAASGFVLKSVVIEYVSNKTGVLVFGGNNVESGQEVSLSGSTAVFTVGNTGSATNGQVRITKIKVTYEPAAK